MKSDRRAEALRWLKQAKAELKDAEFLKDSGRFYLALFLCQQSAEKALKAFIYSKEDEPVLSHSVESVVELGNNILLRENLSRTRPPSRASAHALALEEHPYCSTWA
jgi:HEPN domain-containing protein